jgi:hypothetical protein
MVKSNHLRSPVTKYRYFRFTNMQKFLLAAAMLLSCFPVFAGRITGTVTDEKGNRLAYASILVKGTSKGTTANNDGRYFIDLDPGNYTIIAQYVGYNRIEKNVTVAGETVVLDFQLSLLQLSMKEAVVRPGGEDPAYEIMRNAIRKRPEYENPLDSFTCEAYIKTLIKTRKLPNKILGKKIEDDDKKGMGVDSAGKGIIFLSESLTRIAFKKPNQTKLEVLSGRQSGSNGYGFNFPTFINFYTNNVAVFDSQLSLRGFVSPVADGAMNFYRFRYLGSFWEDGKEINQVKVIPKRKFEPVFSGIINITEGDWRIHSLDLLATREAQLQVLDTLTIKQIHMPVSNGVWQTKDQVIGFTFKLFGIDAIGNFLNVYNKYDVNPEFRKKYFNNVVVTYDTAVNKKSKQYWDSIRPIQLEPEEARDYKIKDSTYQARLDSASSPRNIDSLKKKQGPIKVKQVLWTGFNRSNFHPTHPVTYNWQPLVPNLQYNTVEGAVMDANLVIRRYMPKWKEQVALTTYARYGFNNQHFNGSVELGFNKRSFIWDEEGGNASRRTFTVQAGKRVSQFNKDNPIRPSLNTFYTLFTRRNYMKIYENWFGEAIYSRRSDEGWTFSVKGLYEDRLPLDNTSDFSFFGSKTRKVYSPNYPFEKIDTQFTRHQALIIGINFEFKPGQKYIQFPRGKRPIGSKYPTIGLSYEKGIPKIFGTDADFDRWRVSVWDDINMKLLGRMRYRVGVGGFIRDKQVYIQDYQHFNGNQLFFASEYLNSFQLAPYYANSTKEGFYAIGHLEHHFNGFLTNKIPFFRRLNWNLVGGANAFYVNTDNNYAELFIGLENVFRVLRVDLIASYLNGDKGTVGVRLGFGGIFGSNVNIGR